MSFITITHVVNCGTASAPKMYIYWQEPSNSKTIPPLCLKRIQRDIMEMTKNPPPGIFVLPDEENMRKMRVLITGPPDSGYHGGMFSFLIGFTDEYPMKPPFVKCLTSLRGGYKLHAHIDKGGNFCLSTLGSAIGLGWSPVMTLSIITLTLQTFLSDKPYYSVDRYKTKESMETYNTILQHEIIKVAVIDVMENINTHQEYFVEKIKTIFNENYDHYINFCTKNMHLDGKKESYPFGGDYVFEFKKLLGKIESIKQHLV